MRSGREWWALEYQRFWLCSSHPLSFTFPFFLLLSALSYPGWRGTIELDEIYSSDTATLRNRTDKSFKTKTVFFNKKKTVLQPICSHNFFFSFKLSIWTKLSFPVNKRSSSPPVVSWNMQTRWEPNKQVQHRDTHTRLESMKEHPLINCLSWHKWWLQCSQWRLSLSWWSVLGGSERDRWYELAAMDP